MELFEAISQHAWKSHFATYPDWFSTFPTMLTIEEMSALSWLAQETSQPGAIIDLGCFVGGSSVSLAHGNAKNLSPKRIRSYDRFEINEKLKWQFLYSRGHEFFEGDDALPLFKKLTSPYASMIDIQSGDVLDQTYTDEISILFIDISKNLNLHNHIGRNFFPGLRKGSVVVQQDFLYFANPWLLFSMHKLERSISMGGYAENYSVFFCMEQALSQADIEEAFPQELDPGEVSESIMYFEQKFPFLRQKEMCQALLKAYEASGYSNMSFQYPNVDKIPIVFR